MPRTLNMDRLSARLGWWGVRMTLIALCALWLMPTVGLFVNSLREKDDLVLNGWWTTLTVHDENERSRTPNAAAQLVSSGWYTITGNVFREGNPEGTVNTFGGGFLGGELADHAAGDSVITPEGWIFTLEPNGDYTLSADRPFTFSVGERFFFNATYPPRLTYENYVEVFGSDGVGHAFMNSLFVTIPSTVLPIAIAAYAAYAIAWMRLPGKRLILAIIVWLLVLPLQMILIPVLRMYRDLGWTGSIPGLWMVHTAYGLPLAIFLLRNFIRRVPREIIDSAQIDGASHPQIFRLLIIPLARPALASVAVFQFLWVWNDMLVARVFVGQHPDKTVLTVRLADMLGCTGYNWEIMTAGAFVMMAIPLVVFFTMQRYFVRGLIAGAVNG